MKFTEILDSILNSNKTLEFNLFDEYDLFEIQESLEKDDRFSEVKIIFDICYFKYKTMTFAVRINMDLFSKSNYKLTNLTKFQNNMLEESKKKVLQIQSLL